MRSVHATLLSAVTLIAALHSTTLAAQSTRQFGIIGGPAWSTMTVDEPASDLKSHVGFMAGLSVVSLKPTSKLGLELDALYMTKGFKSTGAQSSFDLNAGFIEVPLLVRVQFAQPRTVQPFLSFGPSFGFNVSCSIDVETSAASSSTSCDDLGSGFELKSFAFSGAVGGGIDFALSKVTVTTGARYTRGFTSATGADDRFDVIGLYLGLARGKR